MLSGSLVSVAFNFSFGVQTTHPEASIRAVLMDVLGKDYDWLSWEIRKIYQHLPAGVPMNPQGLLKYHTPVTEPFGRYTVPENTWGNCPSSQMPIARYLFLFFHLFF